MTGERRWRSVRATDGERIACSHCGALIAVISDDGTVLVRDGHGKRFNEFLEMFAIGDSTHFGVDVYETVRSGMDGLDVDQDAECRRCGRPHDTHDLLIAKCRRCGRIHLVENPCGAFRGSLQRGQRRSRLVCGSRGSCGVGC